MVETITSNAGNESTARGQAETVAPTAEWAGVYGVLLAGGHAWGEWSIESVCPRPLLPIAGRPLVGYLLEWLHKSGVRKASVCANSDTGVFRRNLKPTENIDLSVDYHEDSMPRGPAGCAYDVAHAAAADLFVIVEASVLVSVDLADVIRSHRQTGAALTVVVEDQDSRAAALGWRRRPIGVYVASREAIEAIGRTGYQDIKEVWIPRLYSQNKAVLTFVAGTSQSVRVIDEDSYLEANRWVVEQLLKDESDEQYRRVGEALVHRSTDVPGSTCVVGPLLIGPSCRIEEGVTLVGPTVVGQGCHLESGAVVSRSVIWQACQIGRNAILDRTILLDAAVVEPELVVRESVLGSIGAACAAFRKGRGSYWRAAQMPVDPSERVLRTAWPTCERLRGALPEREPGLTAARPVKRAKVSGRS